MKNYTLLFILLAICQVGFAQNKTLEKANKLFASQAYAEAITAYENELELDADASLNLADAYYFTGDATQAVEAYDLAWELNEGFT